MDNTCISTVCVSLVACGGFISFCEEFMWKIGSPDFGCMGEDCVLSLHDECYLNQEVLRKSKEDFLTY